MHVKLNYYIFNISAYIKIYPGYISLKIYKMRLLQWLPLEVEEQILWYLDSDNLRNLGETNIPEYIWIRIKHKTIEEAIKDNNSVGVKYLIDHGAIVNTSNSYNLQWFITHGYLDIVKKFFDENTYYDDFLCSYDLRYAAMYGHFDIIKYCIEERKINIRNAKYILEFSAIKGHLDIVKYIAKRYIKDNYSGIYSTLYVSAARGYLDIVIYLFEEYHIDITPIQKLFGTLSISKVFIIR